MSSQNLHTLVSARYSLPLPLRLSIKLKEEAEQLELLNVLRILPHKRVVALAQWQGETVIAKLFYDQQRWQQHLQRELKGISAMQAAAIPCAPVLAQGVLLESSVTDRKGAVLLMHYLEHGDSLGTRWENYRKLDQQILLRRVISQIAWCHHRGLIQQDIHLDNFLLQNDTIFLLDAAAIEMFSPAGELSLNDCLDNLALFFAQFPVSNDEHVPTYYQHYLSCRKLLRSNSVGRSTESSVARSVYSSVDSSVESSAGSSTDNSLVSSTNDAPDDAGFVNLLHQRRNRRWQLYSRKLFRETSANCCEKRFDRFVVYERSIASAELDKFINDPDSFIRAGQIIKAGNTATVAAITVDGRKYVVKRYNIQSFWHGISRAFRPSRAWVSWRNAHMLQMLGLGTAKPWLMMERRAGPLRRHAFFLDEFLPGLDVLHLLQKEPIKSTLWQTALQQFRELFQVMQQYQIVHGDMKATNFISTPEQLLILDLDAMRQESGRAKFYKAFNKDLQRFLNNWQGNAPAEMAVRELIMDFIMTALGTGPNTGPSTGSENKAQASDEAQQTGG
jgi:tRNA A-37 threonylcarbamoyl transferase component Bud32